MRKLLVFLFFPTIAFAQQDPQTSLNFESNPFYNPALTVNNYKLNVAGEHRQQWVGFDGAPMVSWAYGSYEAEKIKSTFGFTYLHDKLGAQLIHDFRLNYAYRWTIANSHQVIPALYVGFQNSSLDGTQLDPIQGNDPNIISTKQSDNLLTIGLGIQYRFRHLVFGFGSSHITGGTLRFNDPNATSTITLTPNLYTVARYDFHLGKLIRIIPKIFVKTDLNTTQTDGGLWVGFDNLSTIFERVDIGAIYRHKDAVVVTAEFKFKWFSLGYAYDIITSDIRKYVDGSHHGFLRVHLFKKVDEANSFDGL